MEIGPWTHQHAIVLVDADGRSWPESESSRKEAERLLHECGSRWFGDGLLSISPLVTDAWDYGKTIGYWVGYEAPLAPRNMGNPPRSLDRGGLANRPSFIADTMRGKEEAFQWAVPRAESYPDWEAHIDSRYKAQEELIQKIVDLVESYAAKELLGEP